MTLPSLLRRSVVKTGKANWKAARTKFAVNDDVSGVIGHFSTVNGRKFGNDIADVHRVTAAAFGQKVTLLNAHFFFFME
jgi:hypothetical protein